MSRVDVLSARDRARESLLIDLRHEIESILEVDENGPRLTARTVYVDAKYAAHVELWQHDEGGADGETFSIGVSLDEWPLVDAYVSRPRIEGGALAFDVELAD